MRWKNNDSACTPFGIWPSKKMPKDCKSGDSYLSCILLIICNRLSAHLTSLKGILFTFTFTLTTIPLIIITITINTTSSSPRWSSFSSTYLLPSLIQTLRLTNPTLLKRQGKDFNGYHFVQFCHLCRKEWLNTWGFTECLNESGTRYNVNTSVSAYFGFIRTPPEEIHWNRWPMMSEVWEGEQIAKESSKGRAHHWRWSLWVYLHR